jgi:hypothetical protein
LTIQLNGEPIELASPITASDLRLIAAAGVVRD